MFFDNDAVSFNILDVIKLKQKNVNTHNSRRNFNAVSFRIKADTVLNSGNDIFYAKDNYVSFVPSRLDYNRISKVDELIVIHFESIGCKANNIEVFEAENSKDLKALFLSIYKCWVNKDVGYKYNCSALFNKILALCYAENYNPNPTASKIQKSVDYLLKHYNDTDLSIGKIAEKSFISEVYFRKLFKCEYGISPQKYIIHLRIQYAKELISTGYYSIKEVAAMSGYADYKYFSTDFKKQVGVSPSFYAYNYE